MIQRRVQVVLASARGPSALRGIMKELGMSSLAISYTGALTCRISSHPPLEVITKQRISLPSAHDLLRRALNEEISVGWFAGEACFIPGWDAILQLPSLQDSDADFFHVVWNRIPYPETVHGCYRYLFD